MVSFSNPHDHSSHKMESVAPTKKQRRPKKPKHQEDPELVEILEAAEEPRDLQYEGFVSSSIWTIGLLGLGALAVWFGLRVLDEQEEGEFIEESLHHRSAAEEPGRASP